MEEINLAREKLVEELVALGYLKDRRIVQAMLRVPRHLFVPSSYRSAAYEDTPLPIGYNQTISAPSMIATMLEELKVGEGDKVLEVGTGSGYNAALLAELAGEKGLVCTIERIPGLVAFARENLRRAGYGKVKVLEGDGTLGYEKLAPWDKIIVTAAAPEIPRPLLEQLRVGGRLVAPVGSKGYQELMVAEKTGKHIKIERKGGCIFVPLIGRYGW
ncbi:MAG: protein-L-isoaspartate O-methyltransferase [Methanobacteriota archaeon]|nr:MAG: protein-L-isoaspartate O-methyltransferase [Euryarchaeota archaeon]